MARATSFTSLNSVSCQKLKPSEIENLVIVLSNMWVKSGMKKQEAEELVRSQASIWKFIEEECSANQIKYGINLAYANYKRNPSKNRLTMKYITEQIQTGLFERYFPKN
ncbi:MAG: hypothetical protein WC584_01655 [Candidatus Pacearchaeota archaeon]